MAGGPIFMEDPVYLAFKKYANFFYFIFELKFHQLKTLVTAVSVSDFRLIFDQFSDKPNNVLDGS